MRTRDCSRLRAKLVDLGKQRGGRRIPRVTERPADGGPVVVQDRNLTGMRPRAKVQMRQAAARAPKMKINIF
jgi:hypothetical protein